MAWNRKKDLIGLRKYLIGEDRDQRVIKWWNTVNGAIFLPKHLHRRLPALHRPSMLETHDAYSMCREFLDYLKSTWYEGPFKDMWNKWQVADTRTTNAAEAFHRLLGTLLQGKYPPWRNC
ncbi:unnamed protein product [Cylicocyclus nassatus]|uniref:Uncharacterized protein n=1 Tax=Cylicocyclus nassatus TaxID=53992 RepID=A0AA36GXV9_CYLNA|nr:unnamed protein product [Cylicocyclus nassatus]